MLRLKTQLLLLLIVTYFKLFHCDCRTSYIVTCDNLSDIDTYKTKDWTGLTIGSDPVTNSTKNLTTIDTFPFEKLQKLTKLVIIGQLNGIGALFQVLPDKLKSLTLYGNDITNINTDAFSKVHLNELILINNNIENLEEDALVGSEIEFIDLSNNKLERIGESVFENSEDSVTRTITIRNNKLANIAGAVFPSGLETLNLDHNKLVNIHNDVLDGLEDLQELTLSHNILAKMPPLSGLRKLKLLDCSNNKITTVSDEAFNHLNDLQILDLGYNSIKHALVLSHLPKRSVPLQINLSFNLLRRLDPGTVNSSVQYPILTLYGNPWECSSWKIFEKFMVENHFTRNACDLRVFNSGNTPFCINDDGEHYPGLFDKDRESLRKFFEAVSANKKLIDCELLPENFKSGNFVVL